MKYLVFIAAWIALGVLILEYLVWGLLWSLEQIT